MDLKNAKCVVTGASSGIGYETTKYLLQEGAYVLAVSRNIEQENPYKNHPRLFLFSLDLSIKENVDRIIEKGYELWNDIDLFYANAGFTYFRKENQADWNATSKIFTLNVISPIYAFQKLKEIKKDQPFHFAITASGMSYVSLPGYALYAGTKGALVRFAESVRHELNEHQKLIMIYPVATKTNFFEKANIEKKPFPIQSVSYVGKHIVKKIKKGKQNIYPSFLFRFSLFLFTLFPFVKSIYIRTQNHLEKEHE